MKPIFAGGVGLFTANYANPEAWMEQKNNLTYSLSSTPNASLIPANLKRRTSLLTRAAAEAIGQATNQNKELLAKIPTIYGSAHGEIATTIEILRQMATESDGLPSPTLFHNSVHNTAAGYVSIATANHSFSTSIAAGPLTMAMALMEGAALLNERGGEALLILADEPPPLPFSPAVAYPLLALAFHISAEPIVSSVVRINQFRMANQNETSIMAELIVASLARFGPLIGNHCAAGLWLVEALLKRSGGMLPLTFSKERPWLVNLEPI